MDEAAILQRRAENWQKLRVLTERSEAGWSRLSNDEVAEFVRLYRQASADLAYLVAHTSNADVVDYLNALVSRAYGQLYQAPRKRVGEAVRDGILVAAQTFRRNAWAFWLCAALFFVASVFSFWAVSQGDSYREFFVSPEMEPLFAAWRRGEFEERTGGESIAMTALYASNNPRVGILMNAVALATFGLGTALIAWANGTLLGALAADMASVGKLGFLLSSVAPHGVSELGGFFVTGAGGFLLGRAMIRPGRRTRSDALRLAGKDAFVLLVLGTTMILVAAPIEGFFSFNPAVPQEVKAGFAALALAGWTAYLGGYGRPREARDVR